MKYCDLSDKDKRHFQRFKRIADKYNVESEQDVQGIVQMLSSTRMKLIPFVSFLIAILCGFFAGQDIINGDIPILMPLLTIVFLWIGAQNLRSIITTIPMVANVYTLEELPKKRKSSKKKHNRSEKT